MNTFVKKLMSKYIHYIYGVLFGGMIIALVISYHNNNVLENRFNTLRWYSDKDLKRDKLSSEKSFKEDYYITQQSNDTTLILTCFGVGFALFSFFTYQSVVRSVSDEVDRMKENYIRHENNYNVQHSKLVKVEKDLLFQSASLQHQKLASFKNSSSISDCALTTIILCEQYSKLIPLLDEEDPYRVHFYNIITKTLKEFSELIEDENLPIICFDYSPLNFKSRVARIFKVLTPEDDVLLHKIVGKIKIENYTVR